MRTIFCRLPAIVLLTLLSHTPLTHASSEVTSSPPKDSTQNLQSLPQKNSPETPPTVPENVPDGVPNNLPKNWPNSFEDTKLQTILSEILEHFATIEAKLVSLNEKLDATRKSLDLLTSRQNIEGTHTIGVTPSVTDGIGTSVQPSVSSQDPDFGFTNDTAVESYREALLLYHAQKYPEATLAFSKFIDENQDHPLSGSAQYYIGNCYLKQNEYKLAIQEFKRVLTSFEHSVHISDALLGLVLAEEALKDSHAAEKHKHLLFSLFPQSPAAAVPIPVIKTLPSSVPVPASTAVPSSESGPGVIPAGVPPTASIESSETPITSPVEIK